MSKAAYLRAAPVLNWYNEHGLHVTPINPNSPTISIPSASAPLIALPHIGTLPAPWETALSIVTPPGVTRRVLEQAKEMGFPAVWLQPGTFDEEVSQYLQEADFEASVLGDGGAGGEGWCVLVDGKRALRASREG